jgi:hypothetical protein
VADGPDGGQLTLAGWDRALLVALIVLTALDLGTTIHLRTVYPGNTAELNAVTAMLLEGGPNVLIVARFAALAAVAFLAVRYAGPYRRHGLAAAVVLTAFYVGFNVAGLVNIELNG